MSAGRASLASVSVARLTSVARLIPALVAVYELRFLLSSTGSTLAGADRAHPHLLQVCLLAPIFVGSGWLLIQSGRGLLAHVGRPRWSGALVRRALRWGSALLALVGGLTLVSALLDPGHVASGHPAGLLGGLGTGTGSTVCSAVAIGLVLAASLAGGRWVVRTVVRWRPQVPRAWAGPGTQRVSTVLRPPAPLPLLAGWSDRGPPTLPVLTAA